MSKDKAKGIVKTYEELKSIRTPYESTWDDITDLVVPNRSKFIDNQVEFRPDTELYDSTAVQSNEYLAATLLNGLVSQETRWFDLEFTNKDFKDDEIGKRLIEQRSNAMYELFNSADSGFYTNVAEMFLDLTAYGTSAIEVHYVPGEGIKYKAIHLSQLYIATDKSGFVDTVFRKFKFTARQAAQMWGIDALSKTMKDALEDQPHKKFEIIRCVKPEESFMKKAKTKHRFYSAYVCVEDCHIISEGGLKHFPYAVPRWAKLTNEDYGRSPAWTALPDIIMVQAMEMSILEVAQKQADPQLLVADDGVMLPINPEAGGLIFGGIDPVTGRNRVQPLNSGGNAQIYDAFLERKKESIRRAFYNNALSMQKLPQMTAEEVMARRDEDFRTLAPNANRVIQEALNPLIKVTYQLMMEHKMFPELTGELKEALKDESLEIRLTSPLSRTAKLQDVGAWNRYFNTVVMPYAQLDPTILDKMNPDGTLEAMAENLGVPYSTLRTSSEVEAIREERRQMQEMQMQMQLAAQADQAEANRNTEGGTPDDGTI